MKRLAKDIPPYFAVDTNHHPFFICGTLAFGPGSQHHLGDDTTLLGLHLWTLRRSHTLIPTFEYCILFPPTKTASLEL